MRVTYDLPMLTVSNRDKEMKKRMNDRMNDRTNDRTKVRIIKQSTVLMLLMLSLLITSLTVTARLDSKAIFDDVKQMTTEEIVAEMKYAVKMGQAGKYYPQDRLLQLEKQMATNQTKEIERFKEQLKKDAEVAQKIEELKQKAIDKAKEKGEEYFEENKDKIQAEVEDQTRRMLGLSETDWIVKKEEFNDMYEKGSEAYEEHAAKYVEVAQKAYDAYNAYNKAKEDHPEAPESAQKLVGFLNATGEALNFAGDKMDGTPLRPIGEILKLYGAATGLGDAAAKNAWEFVHRDGINPNVQSQYSEGLKKAGLGDLDFGGIEKSDIMMFDKNMRVLKLANGEYAVFNDKFELVPGGSGNTLTADEYKKLEEMYVAFANGKKDGWPDLNAEQLAKLARGEKVKVTVDDNMWPFSDEVKELDLNSIMAMGERHADKVISDDIITSLDRIINGDQGIIDKLADPFTRRGRQKEILDLFSEFNKNSDSFNSMIHDREAFLEWIKAIKDANKDLSPEELKKKIKEMLDKRAAEDKAKDADKDAAKDKDKDATKTKNPLLDKLKKIDPKVKNADAAGVNKGDKPASGGNHWTQQAPDNFNGKNDGGFSNTGGTTRPMPGGGSPQSIGIPVLKPNIYLYPESPQEVVVTFRYPQLLTTVIPDYVNYWKVMAEPSGLIDQSYDFLFYEAYVQKVFFQTSVGWRLPTQNREEIFEKILNLYRFNPQEKQDFIEFWEEKLDAETTYLVYPQETATINQVMPMDVEPRPTKAYRIWFYFIPDEGQDLLEPIQVDAIVRDGFTVVEWGGMYQ